MPCLLKLPGRFVPAWWNVMFGQRGGMRGLWCGAPRQYGPGFFESADIDDDEGFSWLRKSMLL